MLAGRNVRTTQPSRTQAITYLLSVVMPVICWYTGIQPPSLFSKTMLVHRPWGTYETILDDDYYKVKRIIILPQQQISLQYHNDREEHWTIVSGSGTVRVGDDTFKASIGSRFFINKRQIHRATADRDSHLVFVEVQLGDCKEDDIVRLEDQYGREGFKYED